MGVPTQARCGVAAGSEGNEPRPVPPRGGRPGSVAGRTLVTAERTTRRRPTPTFERGCEEVIKWKNSPRVLRVAMFLAAIAAFAVASGAGTRWG